MSMPVELSTVVEMSLDAARTRACATVTIQMLPLVAKKQSRDASKCCGDLKSITGVADQPMGLIRVVRTPANMQN
jgi:hypothetical protein